MLKCKLVLHAGSLADSDVTSTRFLERFLVGGFYPSKLPRESVLTLWQSSRAAVVAEPAKPEQIVSASLYPRARSQSMGVRLAEGRE